MPRSITSHIDAKEKVGKRLREARERRGLSQRQLAFPGCTAAYISRLEAGARVASLQMLYELAPRLGVSVSWLATGKEADPASALEAELILSRARIEELESKLRAIRRLADV